MLNMQIEKARKLILSAVKDVVAKGLVTGSWGNISLKFEKDCYAITPSGHRYSTMSVEDIAIINADGIKLTGDCIPSSEMPLHLEIYKTRPDVRAIVHTHSIYATACSTMHKSIPPLIEDLAQVIGGEICTAKYAISGSKEIAQNAVKALGKRNAVLLANHGVVCCGRDLDEALIIAELVEKAARIYCIVASINGGGIPLADKDIVEVHDFYNKHYRKRQIGEEL
jgi:L-fuculose-phosphate aldolase